MCVHIYVYIYVCVHICVYVYMCVWFHVKKLFSPFLRKKDIH
jgi:hypothetical protein